MVQTYRLQNEGNRFLERVLRNAKDISSLTYTNFHTVSCLNHLKIHNHPKSNGQINNNYVDAISFSKCTKKSIEWQIGFLLNSQFFILFYNYYSPSYHLFCFTNKQKSKTHLVHIVLSIYYYFKHCWASQTIKHFTTKIKRLKALVLCQICVCVCVLYFQQIQRIFFFIS